MADDATPSRATVLPIGPDDSRAVMDFLHQHLNTRVPPARWAALLNPPWGQVGPNQGFKLVNGHHQIVGVYVAVYSIRSGGAVRVCNLAAFCVLEEHRSRSLLLLRALLRQKDWVMTDLSPSGVVPALNERLGFEHLDTSTRLVLNRPRLSRRNRISTDPAVLQAVLRGADATVFADHRHAAAARHLLVQDEHGHGYLVFRRDRRKRLPLFASPLYAGGDPGALRRMWPAVSAHLLAQGLPATLAEKRVLGFTPSGPGRDLEQPRPKMSRGTLPPEAASNSLYSELTLLEW